MDYLLIFNERQLDRVGKEFVHSIILHDRIPTRKQFPEELQNHREKQGSGKILAFPVLYGLHHHYRRAA